MKKLLLTTVATFAATLFAYTQNLTPSKAISFIKQPYAQVKASLVNEGYSFIKKDADYYVFEKQGFELTVALKQNYVNIISVDEAAFHFKTLYSSVSKLGFKFTKSTNGTTYNSPGSMLRFDKEQSLSCYFVTPINVRSTGVMSVVYGNYTK